MIDTTAITFNEKDFTILDHNRFSPCTENLFKYPYIKVTGKSMFKAINNPTKAHIAEYGYLPRITLFKALRRGGFSIFIRVEFSIPKLLYGNNFDEGKNWHRVIYDKIRQLNRKIYAETNIKYFFTPSMYFVEINPTLLI